MIIVYFETDVEPMRRTAEIVAVFQDDDVYNACVPTLEKLAKKKKMILTESMEEEAWPVNA